VVECSDAGAWLSTRIDPIDCDVVRGFVGDSSRVHTNCAAALAGQSGDGCAASFVCVRAASLPCCIEVASCIDAEEPLLRTRACAEFCPQVPVASGDQITSCDKLADAAAGREASQLLGRPCRGPLLCDGEFHDLSDRAADWDMSLLVYTCAVNAIQVFSTLPNYPVPVDPTAP
jgi:hypothetical protein